MTQAKTSRYDRRREQIIAAATTLVNERGAHGISMRDVAEAVDLQPATLAYYFKNKDQLAAALFEMRLAAIDEMIRQAEQAADPPARVRKLVALELEQVSGVIEGSLTPLSSLPTSNDGPALAFVGGRIRELFTRIDGLFQPPAGDLSPAMTRHKGGLLIGLLFFMPLWVHQYPISEFGRIEDRAMDLLSHGLALPGSEWRPRIVPAEIDVRQSTTGTSRRDFLRTATGMLNQHGYSNTSVDRIAEELNVTKGSFYHHFVSKDELIAQCVSSNFRRMSAAISNAKAAGGPCDQQIGSAIATLLDLQFANEWNLLRSTALASLPPPMREEAINRSHGIALRFAGLIFDGVVEGTVRAVDPLIAGHVINSTIYTAYNLQEWAAGFDRSHAVQTFAGNLWHGVFG